MDNNELEEILLNAGWFRGRNINIDNYMAWYQRYGFTPGISVLKVLEEFGDLTFRIPFFYETSRSNGKRNAYWKFYITPLFFIDDSYDLSDIDDSKCYISDINRFMNLNLFPIAEAIDLDELRYAIFMADTGEIVGAYEGSCGIIGNSFEDALKTLMTKECATFEYFQ
ncbi:MAG: SUKH-3 domain-containing protein [Oscillospiraceae bacterium]